MSPVEEALEYEVLHEKSCIDENQNGHVQHFTIHSNEHTPDILTWKSCFLPVLLPTAEGKESDSLLNSPWNESCSVWEYDPSDDGGTNYADEFSHAFSFFESLNGLQGVLARYTTNWKTKVQPYVGPPRASLATAYIAQAIYDRDKAASDFDEGHRHPLLFNTDVSEQERARLIKEAVMEVL